MNQLVGHNIIWNNLNFGNNNWNPSSPRADSGDGEGEPQNWKDKKQPFISNFAVKITNFEWNGLDWIGLDWIGLNWIELDWIGLNWIEVLNRIELQFLREIKGTSITKYNMLTVFRAPKLSESQKKSKLKISFHKYTLIGERYFLYLYRKFSAILLNLKVDSLHY